MSQRSLSVKDATESLLRDRIYTVEDEVLGMKVDEFQNDKFPTHTPDGFEFLVQNTLESRGIRDVCEQFLVRPYWGFIKIFGSKLPSDYVYRFLPGSLEPINAITILLCSPDSEFVFWNGSAVIGIKKKYKDMSLEDDEDTCIEEDEEDKAVSKLWGLLANKEHRFRELGACGNPAALKSEYLRIADSVSKFAKATLFLSDSQLNHKYGLGD
ncbi:hypothetical protein BM221_008506 [Beauveria bassiana]|uniref:Uncharacterized protein n=1 Tax=Beauveria bassiana TaxID=176275 RepID=A0A2N6NCZ9_BEABA|nr:hypothetical protein BM221_008506 [Beauveria bassiana]